MLAQWAIAAVEETACVGVRTMTQVAIDILFFWCLWAVGTGIVIATANLLG